MEDGSRKNPEDIAQTQIWEDATIRMSPGPFSLEFFDETLCTVETPGLPPLIGCYSGKKCYNGVAYDLADLTVITSGHGYVPDLSEMKATERQGIYHGHLPYVLAPMNNARLNQGNRQIDEYFDHMEEILGELVSIGGYRGSKYWLTTVHLYFPTDSRSICPPSRRTREDQIKETLIPHVAMLGLKGIEVKPLPVGDFLSLAGVTSLRLPTRR